MRGAYNRDMAVAQETIRMTGIRCERCVGRLAAALQGHEGLESASANLVGDVTLAWNEELHVARCDPGRARPAGFREAPESWE